MEVTHGDTWETRGITPILSTQCRANHIKAIEVVVTANETIEDEDLADNIDDVENFADEVCHNQIVTVSSATYRATYTGHTACNTQCASGIDRLLV